MVTINTGFMHIGNLLNTSIVKTNKLKIKIVLQIKVIEVVVQTDVLFYE